MPDSGTLGPRESPRSISHRIRRHASGRHKQNSLRSAGGAMGETNWFRECGVDIASERVSGSLSHGGGKSTIASSTNFILRSQIG